MSSRRELGVHRPSTPAREAATTDPLRWLEALGDTADGLYVVDHQQRIVRWNLGAQRVLGHTADEVLNRRCHEVIGGCDRNGRPVCGTDCPIHQSVARGELPPSVEIQARTRDGPPVWLHLSVIVIPHAPGPLKAHILHDVSDHRHATEFMAQVTSMLHRATPPAPDPADAESGPGENAAGQVCGADTLTPRERAVLRLMAEGLSNRAIAGRLQVSAFTVRNHVQHVLTKFGAHTRAHAVSLALRGGLFR